MIEKTFVEKITELVRENEACRNSDVTLTIALWKRYFPQRVEGDVVKLSDLYDLPREDAVKRIRAALCHEAEQRIEKGEARPDEYIFFPTSEKVAKQRQINEAVWKKALGYFSRPVQMQTTQLPRPVGNISFHQTSEGQYVAQGADRKEYKVASTPEGYWSCECEAFRYASRSTTRTCKHIRAIQDHLKEIEAEQAAKSQVSLFNK